MNTTAATARQLIEDARMRHTDPLTSDGTVIQCMMCGDVEGHHQECPIPVLERWLKKDRPAPSGETPAMSVAGRWSYAQVKAIHRSLHDWLVAANVQMVVVEITVMLDPIHWYLINLRRGDGSWV